MGSKVRLSEIYTVRNLALYSNISERRANCPSFPSQKDLCVHIHACTALLVLHVEDSISNQEDEFTKHGANCL